MSGFEVAGLVLGAFPIFLQCLEAYLEIRDMKDFKPVLKRLNRQLKTEKCKFTNTCRNLVNGIVSADQAHKLASGTGWDDRDFQDKLHQRLGLETAAVFVEVVGHLFESLTKLSDEVSLNREQKSMLERVKFALQQKNYLTTLEEIRNTNTDLSQLSRTASITAPALPRNSLAAENYNRIREHARSLYSVLQERFLLSRCFCREPHNASLRLHRSDQDETKLKVLFEFEDISAKRRTWRALEIEAVACELPAKTILAKNVPEILLSGPNELGGTEKRTFRIPEGIRESWDTVTSRIKRARSPSRGTEPVIKPKKMVSIKDPAETNAKQHTLTSKAEIAAKQIHDLCSAIEQATTKVTSQSSDTSSNTYIGILVDESNGLLHRIYPPIVISPSYLSNAISLRELLVPQLLEPKVRLELGFQLALAVMQLHASEWLTESWGTQDIFFLQRSIQCQTIDGQLISVRKTVVDKPFVRRVFTPPSIQQLDTTQATTTKSLVQCNKSLFSLGVVLIELWFEKPIEGLGSIDTDSTINDNWVYKTAEKHLGELIRVAGENYGFAVSRCLNGLSRPLNDKSLDCLAYKNAVHTDIICLLEKNLKAFTDTSDCTYH